MSRRLQINNPSKRSDVREKIRVALLTRFTDPAERMNNGLHFRTKGRPSPTKGLTYEQIFGLERATAIKKVQHMNHPDIEKERNPNWRGGKSFEPYPTSFDKRLKRRVYERDGLACQLCGSIRILVPHHIGYDKSNCSERNLITLCKTCNCKVNSNRKYWTEHFRKVMEGKYKILCGVA